VQFIERCNRAVRISIKVVLREIGWDYMDCNNAVQERGRWWVLVKK
jgi:hypothetical protein